MIDEKEELLVLYKKSKTVKEATRYHAVLLVKTGTSMTQTARLFFVDLDTIRLWIHKWNEEKCILDRKRSGRPPQLTSDQEQEICQIVDENNPQKEGYDVSRWDCPELQVLIKEKYIIDLSYEAIRKMLRRNGFCYCKTEYLFLKRNEEQRRSFVAETLDISESKFENTVLFFGDEMSTKLHPKNGYAWTRNGKVLVETKCSHKRINTIAAVNPMSGETASVHVERNDTESFLIFLKTLLEKCSQNIVLILDNYSVHHSKKVQEFLDQNPRLHLKFLPPYSPDLNPAEWLWGFLRLKYLNGKAHETVDALIQTLKTAFEVIKPEKIKEICTLKILEKHRIT